MKKINIFQILNIINMAMQVVEGMKSKNKYERIETAIDVAGPFVAALEDAFGKEMLKEQEIKPLVEEYITSAKNLVNGIQRFKNLRS